MSFGLHSLLVFGLLWTAFAFSHNGNGREIDEIIRGYVREILQGKDAGNKKPDTLFGNVGKNQHFFEYIDDQINTNSSDQIADLYMQLQEHPIFQSAVEKCRGSRQLSSNCDPLSRYRSYDGSCNNLEYPEWGSVQECIQRFLPIYYEGTHGIRRSVAGCTLPRPRDLSVNICSGSIKHSAKISFLFAIFAQFVAHDISFSTPDVGNSPFKCCPPSPKMDKRCDPILVRPNDPFYSKFNLTCIPNVRTDPCRKCTLGKRQQANGVTAAVDASAIYGTSKDEADQLRAFDGTGSLITGSTRGGKLLPPNQNPKQMFCPRHRTNSCFKSGDERVNQHTPLMSMHTIFMREHNRIVKELKKLNPHWEEETLYQEGRKIVGGEFQAIVYKELLPWLVGPKLMEGYHLRVGQNNPQSSPGTRYDPSVRFGTWAEYSTAAMRFHSTIHFKTGMYNVTFKDLYSNTKLIHHGGMNALLMGLSQTPSARFSKDIVKDVNGYLYLKAGASSGFDLASFDIARGRDHGLPPYIRLVEFCSTVNVRINEFDDLGTIMSSENIQLLKDNYADVLDVDAWLGMQLERKAFKAVVGPTAACVIAKQFFSLKFGDRFYFEHVGEQPSFTPAQREALKNSSLSRIFCDNSEIREMQENALLLPSYK